MTAAGRSRAPLRVLASLIGAALLWLLIALQPAAAQTDNDYSRWESFAGQVEQALDSADTSDAALQQMRSTIVVWRSQFADWQNTRSTRLTTLQDELAALGAAPAEGASEPEDIAARRQQLNDELAAEQAPNLRASQAYGRADGIITQIDRTLRARQTTQLLQVSPSPLLPSSWQAALDNSRTVAGGVASEVNERVATTTSQDFARMLPGTGLLLATAVLLLLIGRRWIRRMAVAALRVTRGRAAGLVDFVVSVAELALPVIGFWLVLAAIETTGLTGPWIKPFILSAGLAGLTYFTGLWIARRLFPEDPAQDALNGLMPPRRDRARRYSEHLVAALALHQLVQRPMLPLSGMSLDKSAGATVPTIFSDAGAGVVHLILITIAAVPLYRLGHLLRKAVGEGSSSLDRAVAGLGGLVRVVAVGAPLGALAGYISAANAVIWPSIMTMAIIGLVILLQRYLSALWRLMRGAPEGETLPLAPVVIGFLLCLAALPILALIWGARPSDLAEVWTRLSNGFRIGTIRLSPGGILTFILVFTLGYSLTRGAQRTLRTSVLPRTRIDAGGQNAIVSGLGYVGIFLAALLAITSAGINLSSLAIVAGALSVGIGFGMQNIVSNFVSGIILLIERPVTVGDWVKVGNSQGIVQRIAVRSTTIRTFDRTEVIVPNSDLITKEVVNWTRGSLSGRIIVPVTVSYGSDTRKVAKVLAEIAEDQPTVLIDPAPLIVFTDIGDTGLNFELRAVIANINQGVSVSTEIRHQIMTRFAEEGITMPPQGTPQREIWLHNPEVLTAAEPAAAPRAHPAKQPADAAGDDLPPQIAENTDSGMEQSAGSEPDEDGNSRN